MASPGIFNPAIFNPAIFNTGTAPVFLPYRQQYSGDVGARHQGSVAPVARPDVAAAVPSNVRPKG